MNFIDDYVEYASEFTDSPPVMHSRIAMSLISTVVNRNAWITQGIKRLYPNLWTLIIAPSSFYRKSHSISIGEDLIRQVNPSLILPKEFSHEKLIETIAEQPQGLMVFYEFKTFLGLMNKDYMSGTKSFITEIYDCPSVYDRKTKAQEIRIENPFLNILSASTIDWLRNALKEDDIAGGFLPRFLMVLAPKKEKVLAFQPVASQTKRSQLIDKLKSMQGLKGELFFSKEAITFYTEWYETYEKKHEGNVDISAFLTRLQDYAKKLSIILTINKGDGSEIDKETCIEACSLTDSYARNAIYLMDGNLFSSREESIIRRIRNILISAGQEGITREMLYRKAHLLARDLEHVIHTLQQTGWLKTVEIRQDNETVNRPKTIYKWLEN